MGIGIQTGLAYLLQKLMKGRRASEVAAQDQGVEKAADKGFDFGLSAIPEGCTHSYIGLSSITSEQELEGREQEHEQGHVLLLAQDT